MLPSCSEGSKTYDWKFSPTLNCSHAAMRHRQSCHAPPRATMRVPWAATPVKGWRCQVSCHVSTEVCSQRLVSPTTSCNVSHLDTSATQSAEFSVILLLPQKYLKSHFDPYTFYICNLKHFLLRMSMTVFCEFWCGSALCWELPWFEAWREFVVVVLILTLLSTIQFLAKGYM